MNPVLEGQYRKWSREMLGSQGYRYQANPFFSPIQQHRAYIASLTYRPPVRPIQLYQPNVVQEAPVHLADDDKCSMDVAASFELKKPAESTPSSSKSTSKRALFTSVSPPHPKANVNEHARPSASERDVLRKERQLEYLRKENEKLKKRLASCKAKQVVWFLSNIIFTLAVCFFCSLNRCCFHKPDKPGSKKGQEQ